MLLRLRRQREMLQELLKSRGRIFSSAIVFIKLKVEFFL